MEDAQKKVEDAIKTISLPDEVIDPKIMRINFNSLPVVSFSISNNNITAADLEQKVRENVLPGLSGINGVGQVQLASETLESVYIKLIPSKLKEYNMTSQYVTQLIQANNVSFPTGSLNINDTVEPIRVTGKFNSLDELKSMQLPVTPSTQDTMESTFAQQAVPVLKQVTLGETAEITMGTGNATSISRTNGSPSVIVQVLKTQESNTVDVSEAVQKKLSELKNLLPKDTETSTTFDQAVKVNESISGMLREGILGALFAFLVILLFLRNFRTTIIACISIPLSILITLIFLKQLNITLNIMTLGGLSVAVGRIVDDSIVVIENIYRHLNTDKVRNVYMF